MSSCDPSRFAIWRLSLMAWGFQDRRSGSRSGSRRLWRRFGRCWRCCWARSFTCARRAYRVVEGVERRDQQR